MDVTPVSAGVLVGLDQLLALSPRSETRDAITALKRDYADRTAHESRTRAAREELQSAEAALLRHGHPIEPSAIVGAGILADIDLRLKSMQAARGKFHEDGEKNTAA